MLIIEIMAVCLGAMVLNTLRFIPDISVKWVIWGFIGGLALGFGLTRIIPKQLEIMRIKKAQKQALEVDLLSGKE